jgi:hypothetical protein
MTGVQLPERTTIGNGRSLFTFVSTDCTKVTELHMVRFGSEQIFLQFVHPSHLAIVQGMTENDRLELRRDGAVLSRMVLEFKQLNQHPLIEVWLEMKGCGP